MIHCVCMKNKKLLWFVCFGIVMLPSCIYKQSKDTQQVCSIEPIFVRNVDDEVVDRLIYQESLLIDIPIPLYDTRIVSAFRYEVIDNTSFVVLGYKSPLAATEVIVFLMNQMERYGWKHLVTFQGPQAMVQFKAPGRYCTVVVESDNVSEDIRIFIYASRKIDE